MPRQLRIEYPGAMYHLMSRGNRREDIFLGDVDRQDFFKTLAEACQKTDWRVHAYLVNYLAAPEHRRQWMRACLPAGRWTGCWASTVCKGTAQRHGRNLSGGWRRGGWSRAMRKV